MWSPIAKPLVEMLAVDTPRTTEPAMVMGVELSVVVPSPSWLEAFAPQQAMVAVLVTAQPKSAPTDRAVASSRVPMASGVALGIF